MFAMENNTPGVYMISQRKMLGNKFNIPKNAVKKYLSKFTPRKKVAAPKTNNRIRKLVKNLANATGVCNNK
jgi:predicted transcriptional regulator